MGKDEDPELYKSARRPDGGLIRAAAASAPVDQPDLEALRWGNTESPVATPTTNLMINDSKRSNCENMNTCQTPPPPGYLPLQPPSRFVEPTDTGLISGPSGDRIQPKKNSLATVHLTPAGIHYKSQSGWLKGTIKVEMRVQ